MGCPKCAPMTNFVTRAATVLANMTEDVDKLCRVLSYKPNHVDFCQITLAFAKVQEVSHMHHLTFGINSLLHSVNLIVFTLLAHLILYVYHLITVITFVLTVCHSLHAPFTPDLKLISFTNPFLHSHSYSFRTDFTDLNLYCIKGALTLFVLVSFSGYVC